MAGSRMAVVVATDEYADPSLGELSSPMRDAEVLARALGDPELGGFDVQVLRNATSYEVDTVLEGVLSERRPDDAVLVHFSCHGLKDESGELYLATTNTLPTRLGSTAVEASFVSRLMRRSRAGRVLLLLDCCYGGAFERGMVARAAGGVDIGSQFQQAQPGQGRGRAVITASSALEYAFEGERLVESAQQQPSVFTSALAEGLTTGDADRDQDGQVGLGELYEYIYDRVRSINPNQTPGKWEYGTEGEFVVARNPNRRVAAAELTAELAELCAHPFAPTRHGAVQQLLVLASGTNLAMAATAREQLVRMCDDDSRQVSEAAARAVEETTVHVNRHEVDVVSLAEPVVVELEGVPLVEASTVRVEGEGVVARKGRRSVTLSAQSGVKAVDALVTVEGPAGAATIHVIGSAPTVPKPRRAPAAVPTQKRRAHVAVTPPTAPVVERPAAAPAPVDPARRRTWLAAGLMLTGTAAGVGTLMLPWAVDERPTEYMGESFAFFWTVPLLASAVAAVLVLVRPRHAAVLGVVAGSALVLALNTLYAMLAWSSVGLVGGFWLASVARGVVLGGAAIALRSGLPDVGEARVRVDARAWVGLALVTSTVVGALIAVAAHAPTADQWSVVLPVSLLLAALSAWACVLALPHTHRVAVLTALSLLYGYVLVSLLSVPLSDAPFNTDLMPALWWVAAVALVAVWVAQARPGKAGTVAARRSAGVLLAGLGLLWTWQLLWVPWTDSDWVPGKATGFVRLYGTFWVLPIVVVAVATLLLLVRWSPAVNAVVAGVAFGGATHLVSAVLQYTATFPDEGMSGGFWLSLLVRPLVVVGLVVATWPELRALRPLRPGWLPMVVLGGGVVAVVALGSTRSLVSSQWMVLLVVAVFQVGLALAAMVLRSRLLAFASITLAAIQVLGSLADASHPSDVPFPVGALPWLEVVVALAAASAAWLGSGASDTAEAPTGQ